MATQEIIPKSNDSEDEETTLTKAASLLGAISFPMTMLATIELGLLEIIAEKEKERGPLTACEVVAELNTSNPLAANMVERMLRLLAGYSVVSCCNEVGKGYVFGVTPVGRHFINDQDGVSLGPVVRLLQDKVFVESWYKLKDAVLEGGIPFDKAHGVGAFEYPKQDPRLNQIFNTAMSNNTAILMRMLLKSYKGFENIDRLVDVGGGVGQNLKIIMSKYPTIKGVNFDLPHVTSNGISHPGMEQVGGDMFECVPEGTAIFMKSILHDWDDDHCIKLLNNCYKALPPKGKIIVMESVTTEGSQTTLAARMMSEKDLIMMTQTSGGKERTKQEFTTLAMASGFVDVRVVARVHIFTIMEFSK